MRRWRRKRTRTTRTGGTHPDFLEQIADDVERRYSGGGSQGGVAAVAVRQNCWREKQKLNVTVWKLKRAAEIKLKEFNNKS